MGIGKMRRDLLILVCLAVILAILPVFVGGNLYVINLLIMCLIYAVIVAAWDLIMGVAGIFTFGQIGLFAFGAYFSAIVVNSLGISPWLGILGAGLATGIIGVLLALPCIRLQGAYVALVTFAFHMIVESFLKSDAGIFIGSGGPQGILSIAPLHFFGYEFSAMSPVPAYYTAFVLSFFSFAVIYKILHSYWGLSFIALRDSNEYSQLVGINEFKYKLIVFAITAVLTGLIGGFYAHYIGMVSLNILGLDLFLMLLVMWAVGGRGRFPGPILGAFITVYLSEILRPFEKYRMLIFGALVILLVVKMPDGIFGYFLKPEKPVLPKWLSQLVRKASV